MRFSLMVLLALLCAGFCPAQDTSFQVGPQYLITATDARFLRPIATPSLSLDAPLPGIPELPQIGPAATEQLYVSPGIAQQPNLFPIYYGYPEFPVVELTGEAPRELPASINDTGYVAFTDVESLRERGYGSTVAEDASFWKTHKRPAPRVFTNADLQH